MANINFISHIQWTVTSQERCRDGIFPVFPQVVFACFFGHSFHTMNAIIALCHFCEFHGPSVLFCTQVILENEVVFLLQHRIQAQKICSVVSCMFLHSRSLSSNDTFTFILMVQKSSKPFHSQEWPISHSMGHFDQKT